MSQPTLTDFLTGRVADMDHTNLVNEAAKALPPATAAAMNFFGYPVADWVSFVMFFYAIGLVSQMVARLARWWKSRKTT